MNELYIQKLISLVKQGIITVASIKSAEYKAEVEKRLASQ